MKAMSPWCFLLAPRSGRKGGCVLMREMVFLTKPIMNKTCRYRNPAPLFLIIFFIVFYSLDAFQNRPNDPREIIDLVEKGIVAGDVDIFSRDLGPQIAISMSGDRSGCYSKNQAFSILKNFFGVRKTLSFTFTTRQESIKNASATGGGRFIRRGIKENLQIYVMLNLVERRWVITQIHLY